MLSLSGGGQIGRLQQQLVIAVKEAVVDVLAPLRFLHQLGKNRREGLGSAAAKMPSVPEGFLVREKLIAVTQKIEVIEGAALLPAE